AERAAVADATVLFLYDAHLFASNRALLEAVEARARGPAVVLLRDPYDAALLRPGVLGITAYGFRKCQFDAVSARPGSPSVCARGGASAASTGSTPAGRADGAALVARHRQRRGRGPQEATTAPRLVWIASLSAASGPIPAAGRRAPAAPRRRGASDRHRPHS